MIAPANFDGSESPGGSGGKSERTDSGRTEIQDARMLRMAVERGWISATRWPTRYTKEQLEEIVNERGSATLVEKATLGTFALLDSPDSRAVGIGVRATVAMERQNLTDDHHEDGSTVHHDHSITFEQRRIEVTGIIAALRERAGTGTIEGTAGDGGGPVGDADDADEEAS